MSVVVIATLTPKPEKIDEVREALTDVVPLVHKEPGCELYTLHEANGAFIFVEQWSDPEALKVHSAAPAVTGVFAKIGDYLAAPPDVRLAQAIPAGDDAKGRLRG